MDLPDRCGAEMSVNLAENSAVLVNAQLVLFVPENGKLDYAKEAV